MSQILKLKLLNKSRVLVFSVIVIAMLASQSFGQQTSSPGKKSICVGPIVAIEAITTKAKDGGRDRDLRQVIQSLDTTLLDQINGSRKFDVVARKAALKSILEEQDFGASGNVDPSSAAKIMQLAGAQFIVMTTITDFAFGQDNVNFNSIGVSANRESVRVNCSIQIYDTTSGKLLESARFRGTDVLVKGNSPVAAGETLTRITDKLSADILNRIVDVIYPAKVVAKLGNQITINRGDGTGIAIGQTWGVYALGEPITDPDTGEVLGQNEAEVGLIKINRITPRLSYGEAFEDNGISKGAILRLKKSANKNSDNTQGARGGTKEKQGGLINSIKNDF
jgi:curli biogenesis system outer membrane secretion channel CsgG